MKEPRRPEVNRGPLNGEPGPPKNGTLLSGFTYFQTISFSGVTSKIEPFKLLQTSVSPLGRRLAPDMNAAKKSAFLGEVKLQTTVRRPECSLRLAVVLPLGVDRKDDLVYRREIAPPPVAVVEHHDVPFPGSAAWDPVRVMLTNNCWSTFVPARYARGFPQR